MICKKCMRKKADPKTGYCDQCYAETDEEKEIVFEEDDDDLDFELEDDDEDD